MEYYQDIWVKEEVIKEGIRDCESRYQMIKPFFERYDRPITVLDLGANFGYFSFRLAEDFPGVFVMIEGNPDESNYLEDLCKRNENKKVIFLRRRITLEELSWMSEYESFDAVLAFNVVHHFLEPYNKVMKVLNKLTDFIILEHPKPEETKTYNSSRVKNESLDFSIFEHNEIIGKVPCHTTNYKTDRDVTFIQTNGNIINPSKGNNIETISTFEFKMILCKRKNTSYNWIHGINFRTFLRLNEVYPTKNQVIEMLNSTDILDGSDIEPWNFIITGEKIELIDINDYRTYVASWYDTGILVNITNEYDVNMTDVVLYKEHVQDHFELFKKIYKNDDLNWKNGIDHKDRMDVKWD